MRSLHRHPEPPEGDIHSHPQLRHESSHGQYADQDDAGSGSGVSVWEDCSARDPQPVPVSDESGSRGFKSKYQRNINTSTHIYINRPYFFNLSTNCSSCFLFLLLTFVVLTLIFLLFCQVSETYDQVHQSMIQTPIKDNVPLFWSTMAQVKTNHYRSMAHYFVASALLDHQCKDFCVAQRILHRKKYQFLIWDLARTEDGLKLLMSSKLTP